MVLPFNPSQNPKQITTIKNDSMQHIECRIVTAIDDLMPNHTQEVDREGALGHQAVGLYLQRLPGGGDVEVTNLISQYASDPFLVAWLEEITCVWLRQRSY